MLFRSETKDAGKQTILLLNRRGNSRSLVCVDCGQAPECPRCSQRLTYHSANERLMCHYCGYSQPVPKRCPSCGGPLKTLGLGTQKVEQELEELYPGCLLVKINTITINTIAIHVIIIALFIFFLSMFFSLIYGALYTTRLLPCCAL